MLPSWVCLLVPYSTCARASRLLRLGCGGHPCPRGSWPRPHGEGSGLGGGQRAGGVDPVWDTCWGWAAAGGPGLSFMFGASEEESSQASGRVMGDTWSLSPAHPSSGPSSAPPSLLPFLRCFWHWDLASFFV